MNKRPQEKYEYNPPSGGSNLIALSLFIIVLAFFIFTVAISEPEDTKKTSLLASVKKIFGGLSMAERKTEKLNGKTENKAKPVDFSPILTGDSELSKYAEITVEYEYSAMVVPSDVFFEKDSTIIKQATEKDLKRIAELVKSGGYSAEIVGYPSSSGMKEARLCAMRSLEIGKFLSEKEGVNAKRIAYFSWIGKRSPEEARTDIEGMTPQYLEITFRAVGAAEEAKSLKFKDFIFKVLD